MPGRHSATGSLGSDGKQECQVYNLVEYIAERGLRRPDLIKIDIEGAEATIVPLLLPYVQPLRTRLLVSTHSDSITEQLVRTLGEFSYVVRPLQWAGRPAVRRTENATLILALPQ